MLPNPRCFLFIGCPKTPIFCCLNPERSLKPRLLNSACTVLYANCFHSVPLRENNPQGTSKCYQEAPDLPQLLLGFVARSMHLRTQKPLFCGWLTYRTILPVVSCPDQFLRLIGSKQRHAVCCKGMMCNIRSKCVPGKNNPKYPRDWNDRCETVGKPCKLIGPKGRKRDNCCKAPTRLMCKQGVCKF